LIIPDIAIGDAVVTPEHQEGGPEEAEAALSGEESAQLSQGRIWIPDGMVLVFYADEGSALSFSAGMRALQISAAAGLGNRYQHWAPNHRLVSLTPTEMAVELTVAQGEGVAYRVYWVGGEIPDGWPLCNDPVGCCAAKAHYCAGILGPDSPVIVGGFRELHFVVCSVEPHLQRDVDIPLEDPNSETWKFWKTFEENRGRTWEEYLRSERDSCERAIPVARLDDYHWSRMGPIVQEYLLRTSGVIHEWRREKDHPSTDLVRRDPDPTYLQNMADLTRRFSTRIKMGNSHSQEMYRYWEEQLTEKQRAYLIGSNKVIAAWYDVKSARHVLHDKGVVALWNYFRDRWISGVDREEHWNANEIVNIANDDAEHYPATQRFIDVAMRLAAYVNKEASGDYVNELASARNELAQEKAKGWLSRDAAKIRSLEKQVGELENQNRAMIDMVRSLGDTEHFLDAISPPYLQDVFSIGPITLERMKKWYSLYELYITA
jgi:hypothetical protein